MSGAVCQRRAPDLMGQEADKGGRNPSGDGDVEAKAAARASEGGETIDATDANGEIREG